MLFFENDDILWISFIVDLVFLQGSFTVGKHGQRVGTKNNKNKQTRIGYYKYKRKRIEKQIYRKTNCVFTNDYASL